MKNMNRVGYYLIILCLFSSVTFAAETVFQQDGIAIKGYDPVNYHTMKQAVKGDSQFVFEWKGVDWLFASQENRDLFSRSPDKYAPEYGGYCAYAASKGSLAPIDPKAWTVHNNILYLNNSLSIRNIWRNDIDSNINKADINWPKLSSR